MYKKVVLLKRSKIIISFSYYLINDCKESFAPGDNALLNTSNHLSQRVKWLILIIARKVQCGKQTI